MSHFVEEPFVKRTYTLSPNQPKRQVCFTGLGKVLMTIQPSPHNELTVRVGTKKGVVTGNEFFLVNPSDVVTLEKGVGNEFSVEVSLIRLDAISTKGAFFVEDITLSDPEKIKHVSLGKLKDVIMALTPDHDITLYVGSTGTRVLNNNTIFIRPKGLVRLEHPSKGASAGDSVIGNVAVKVELYAG